MTRQNLRDRIYDNLIQRIRSGAFGLDDRFVDVMVAAELGSSRMPARDALMRLATEGYLVPTTRGFVLPRLGPEEILEVFELRRLLEPRAAALAAQGITDAALAVMERAVTDGAAALAARDGPALFTASEIFRNAWLSVVSNRTLAQAIRRYFVQVQNVRLITMQQEEVLPVILAGQRSLLAAYRERDAVAAGDRMLCFVIEGEIAFRRTLTPA
jgi:DNA-binding GntR family transcriptional regulator